MAEEIETLRLLTLHLETSFASDDTVGDLAVRCLNMCHLRCASMQELTSKVEAASRRSKTLGRLRTASADKDMQQLLASLEGAKSSLVLACHVLSEYVLSTCAFSCAPADMLQRSRRVAEHSASMALMNQQAHLLRVAADGGYKPAGNANQTKSSLVPRTPATECLAINANNNLAEDQDSLQSRTVLQKRRDLAELPRAIGRGYRYSARLRPWYVRRIWDVTVTRACAGWDIKIRSYHVRPADASIFTYAALGDLASCRKLIERGLASPFDVAFPFYPFNSPTHVLCVSCSVCVNSFIRVLADGDSSMQHHRATLICVAT